MIKTVFLNLNLILAKTYADIDKIKTLHTVAIEETMTLLKKNRNIGAKLSAVLYPLKLKDEGNPNAFDSISELVLKDDIMTQTIGNKAIREHISINIYLKIKAIFSFMKRTP